MEVTWFKNSTYKNKGGFLKFPNTLFLFISNLVPLLNCKALLVMTSCLLKIQKKSRRLTFYLLTSILSSKNSFDDLWSLWVHTKGLEKFIKAQNVSGEHERLHFIAPRDGPQGIEDINTPLADSTTVSKNGGNSLSFTLATRGALAAFHFILRARYHISMRNKFFPRVFCLLRCALVGPLVSFLSLLTKAFLYNSTRPASIRPERISKRRKKN